MHFHSFIKFFIFFYNSCSNNKNNEIKFNVLIIPRSTNTNIKFQIKVRIKKIKLKK